jgi:hypothetical protein
MKVILGSTSIIGKSLANIKTTNNYLKISKREGKDQLKLNLDNLNINNNPEKLNKIKTLIFLASKSYTYKNIKNDKFKKEYIWLKKVIKLFKIQKLIYISSSSVHKHNHKVGKWKKKCEQFLVKNKKKFITLQIWRPYNIIGVYDKFFSHHLHYRFFKKIFIENKKKIITHINKNINISYCSPDNFAKTILKYEKKKSSFIIDYKNSNYINLEELSSIFKEYVYKNYKKRIYFYFKHKNIKNFFYKDKNITYLKVNENTRSLVKKFIKKMIEKYAIKKL